MIWLMVHESWFCSWFCSWFGLWFGSWFGLWYIVHGVLNSVLLEHGGLHCVLPCAVHPDLGHPPDTQEYLGLLSEQFNTT